MIKRLRVTLQVLYASILFVSVTASVAATGLVLRDPLMQGSLVRGAVPVGSQLWWNDAPVKLSPQGEFVIGFSRDDAKKHSIVWQLPNGERFSREITPQQRQYDIQRIDGIAPTMVTPPAEVKARITRDNQAVAAARSAVSDYSYVFSDFIMPAQGRISGVYGSQRILNGESKQPHFGVDIAAPVGTPVIAPAAGIVTLASDLYYSGNTLIIDHGMGVFSTFLHLDSFQVAVGDLVVQGQQIATIGATGRVTGPHLDWRINLGRMRLDPSFLVPELAEAVGL